ncbi:MAG TPA: poly-beta-1,6-N-acetyl-D-glucosamine biosynthesis protein PgaD [Burkholderiales bacterium]|nr:poly-beta-1,6-N-acetyl-D-glucosamine biosynthesis protein PgaD [Burkholderiales bacterium]
MSEHIIDRPDLLPPARRAFFSALTVVFWTFYLYLLMPLATLIAWYVGWTAVYGEMVMRRGWEALVELLTWYSLIVLIMGLVQIGWASINWARFRGKRDRRRFRERQVDIDMQKMFMTDIADLAIWQDAKRIVVRHHKTHSKIVAVEAA